MSKLEASTIIGFNQCLFLGDEHFSESVGRHKYSESTPHEEVAVCGYSACIKPGKHSLELLNEYLQNCCLCAQGMILDWVMLRFKETRGY